MEDESQFVYQQRDHSRYVPLPPHPNFHHFHPNLPQNALNFPPPPPPPPPPPHPSYRHLPMPPSPSPSPAPLAYNPSQPQFTLPSINHDDDHLRSIHRDRDRDRDRDFTFDGGFYRDLNHPTYHGSPIPHSPIDFERHTGMYYRETDHRLLMPYPPVDHFRYSSANDSRLGLECNDNFQSNPRDEVVIRGRGAENYHHHGHGQFKADPHVSFLESGVTLSQSPLSRDNEFISGGLDKHRLGSTYHKEFFRGRRGRGSAVSKNQRWVHSKQQGFRNIHNEAGSSDRGDCCGNDFRTASGKHGHYRQEFGKYYNDKKGSTEGYITEYTSSPRKPIQKKSAFLRIQLANPSHINRESEQLNDSDYFDDKNNSSFKVKSQVRSLGHRMDEGKKREGSPMELDVSFKSNSLVAKAKAIVASTQPGAVSDMGVTPRNEKITKVLVPDHKSPDSNLTGQNKDNVATNCVLHLATYPAGLKYELKESEEKVTGLLVDNISNISTEASSIVSNYSPGKTSISRPSQTMVLDNKGNVRSGKAPPMRALKKKKIVRKVVKKVVNPQLCSQAKKSDDEPVDVDILTNIPTVVGRVGKCLDISKKKSTVSRMNPVHFVLKSSQRENSGSLEKRKADQSFLPLASAECKDKTHMEKECIPEDKSDKNSSNPLINSLIKDKRGTGGGDHLKKNDSFIDMPPLLNSNEDPKLLNEPDFGRVKPTKSMLGEVEDSLLENVSGKESGLLSSKDPNQHGDLVIGNSLPYNIDIPMDLDVEITQSRDNDPLSETYFLDGNCKQLCADKVTAPPETDTVGVSASKVMIISSLVGVSNSSEAGMQIDCTNSECYSSNRHTIQNSDDYSNCTNIRVSDSLFNSETIGNTREGTSVDRNYVSLGINSQEISPKDKVSGGKDEKPIAKMIEIENCLGVVTPNDINEEIKNFEDPCIGDISRKSYLSEYDVPGHGSVVLGVKSTPTRDSVMHSYNVSSKSSKNKSFVCTNINSKQNEKSPKCRKKQKKCVASPVLPCSTAESDEGPAISFSSCHEDPLTSHGDLMEGEEVAASTVDSLYTVSSTGCSKGFSLTVNDALIKESDGKVDIDNGPLEHGLKHEYCEKHSPLIPEELIVSKFQSHYPSALGNEQKVNGTPIMATNQFDNMDIDIGKKEQLGVHVSDEQSIVCNETAQGRNSSEVPSQTFNCLDPITDKASDNLAQDSLHYLQNHRASPVDGNGCSTANSHNEIMGSMFDAQVDMGSPVVSNVPGIHKLNVEASPSHIDFKMDCADDRKAEEKSLVENKLRALTDTSSSQSITIKQKLGHTKSCKNSSVGKVVVPLAVEESKSGVQAQNNSADSRKKKQVGYYNSQTFPGKSFSTYTASKKLVPATHITKPRSWHRNVNSLVPLPGQKALPSTVPPQEQSHGKDGILQGTSYIRKGNSLVRKSSQVATRVQGSHNLSSSSSDQHDCKPSVKAYKEAYSTNPPFLPKAKGIDTPVDKSYTPSLPCGSRSPDHSISLRDSAPSPFHETESDLVKSKDISDLSMFAGDSMKISLGPESLTVSADKMENQAEAKDMTSTSSIVKKIVYVKRKSNQLVATSNPHDLSTTSNNVDKMCSFSADGYYKRNKNQLIRASLECQKKQTLLPTDNISNSGVQNSSGDGDGRSFNKKPVCKAKTHRPSKSSLVWTLSPVAPGNGVGNLQNQRIVPRLFPWKRAYWRTLKLNTPHKNNSFSVVRKLLLLRNRNTLYERSKHGFSLRKSKVVSVGRSSLKWSKSIENRSKKANEEATRAVADEERRKRERNCDASACAAAQGGNPFSYDKSSCSTTLKSEKSAKKFYNSRRLVIGNDEYVKIGNGNQLVRNPKRRARILANEKVRWSLHTARQRLAKKRKYCQFFTRFGKCDKDGGKCPYIHDTSKIAVCTKFLNGLCSNPGCKLTHKVIPERMPDCSYFLQGLCSSKNCAYRHVHVNSKATTCEAFLRGYCALGNECRKKHSYVCPLFEATGTCPEGSKCKLHHPKKQPKGRKRKRSGGKNGGQRYFGFDHIDVSGSRVVVTEKHPVKSTDQFPEGDLADYISLDVSDEEIAEGNNSTSWTASFCEGSVSDFLLDDPDELIKPVRIMNKNPTANADSSIPPHSVQVLPMCL